MGKGQAGQAYSSLLVTDYSLKQPYTQSSTDKKNYLWGRDETTYKYTKHPIDQSEGEKSHSLKGKHHFFFFKLNLNLYCSASSAFWI